MKDAKGHGSEKHDEVARNANNAALLERLRAKAGGHVAAINATVPNVVQAQLQPHGKPVPADSMHLIESHLKAGGELFVPSYTKPTIIPAKAYENWAKAGQPLLKPEGQGYRMRKGKSSVYLLPNQLMFTH